MGFFQLSWHLQYGVVFRFPLLVGTRIVSKKLGKKLRATPNILEHTRQDLHGTYLHLLVAIVRAHWCFNSFVRWSGRQAVKISTDHDSTDNTTHESTELNKFLMNLLGVGCCTELYSSRTQLE